MNPEIESITLAQAGAVMLPEENSGTALLAVVVPSTGITPHETPAPCATLQKPEDARWREANRRLQLIQKFKELMLQPGRTRKAALKMLGVDNKTFWEWQNRFAAKGYNGLIRKKPPGRPDTFASIGKTPAEVELFRKEVQGFNLDMQSVTGALRLFAHSDRCPADLAAVILDPNRSSKHALPPSLRNLARVNKPLKLAHRGPRALALGGIWTPRKMDVLPGDIFVADDTTPIWAWWVPWYTSKEYPFGVKLLQGQLIPVMDVASQCVISYVMIAREKSSYRACDIWHLFGHTFDTVGLPRLGFQLERGSWESNIIRGQEVEIGTDEVSITRRVGGLRQLPTNITSWHLERFCDGASQNTAGAAVLPKTLQTWTSYLPKSKSIEAFFNRSQTMEGTLWGALGRDQMRNPFEKAKKQFQACQRGAADPRLHFLSFTELSQRLSAMMQYLNHEPMEGEVFKGVPQINFNAAVAEHPLFQLPDELRWLYQRDWAVVQITSGMARARLTHPVSGDKYSLFYCNPEIFAAHEGEKVALYFDRENFEQPAQIILAKTGEYLCGAEYLDRRGSFLEGDQSGHDIRKQWKDAVLSNYGTVVKHAPSRQLPPEIAARRAEAKNSEFRIPNSELKTVDHRPAAAGPPARSLFAAPTPEQVTQRRNQLSQKAALTHQLNALRGE